LPFFFDASILDGASKFFSQGTCATQRRVRQQHNKFFAAVASSGVTPFDILLEHLRNSTDHLVAKHMTIGIIDVLEVIDVTHQ
jgi:hypothetical protein